MVHCNRNTLTPISTEAPCATLVWFSICVFPFSSSVPPPASVTITSNQANPVNAGSTVRVICTVELSPVVVDSDLSALMVDAQLSSDRTPLTLTGPTVDGITFTYTIQLDSFGTNDSGNYTCTATVRPQPPTAFLNRSGVWSSAVIGMCFVKQCERLNNIIHLQVPP